MLKLFTSCSGLNQKQFYLNDTLSHESFSILNFGERMGVAIESVSMVSASSVKSPDSSIPSFTSSSDISQSIKCDKLRSSNDNDANNYKQLITSILPEIMENWTSIGTKKFDNIWNQELFFFESNTNKDISINIEIDEEIGSKYLPADLYNEINKISSD